MRPVISVIVPTYKVEAYLPRCLDSIVAQTYQNLEIILVDDGSPDNGGAICDAYAQRDNRIKVIHQKNAGVAAARNAGLDIMTGTYLMFVDPDDWLSLDAVEVLYDRMMADGSDMAAGRYIRTYDDGSMDGISASWMMDGCYSPDELIIKMGEKYYFPVSAWGKLYKYEYYADLKFPNMQRAEDLTILCDVLKKCEKISVTEKTLYYYYQRTSSMIHTISARAQRDWLKGNLNMMEYVHQKGLVSAVGVWFAKCIEIAFGFEDKDEALEMIMGCLEEQDVTQYLSQQNWLLRLKWKAMKRSWLERAIRIAGKVIGR